MCVYIGTQRHPSCSAGTVPGVAWMLNYKPRPNQDFFSSIFVLPYDTPFCPFNIFMNLNASKEMTGLSFYSSCIEFHYDSLLFQNLNHRFYFPINKQFSDCHLSKIFTQRFSEQDFGLILHSSLSESIKLGKYLKLYPGTDEIAMSFGFSKSQDMKVGLLHNVEVDIFGTQFNTTVMFNNHQMSFSGQIEILDYLYQANVKATTNTFTKWNFMEFDMIGWFPKSSGTLASIIEAAVKEQLRMLGSQAERRRGAAAHQRQRAFSRYENITREREIAYAQYTDASNKHAKTQQQLNMAEQNLTEYSEVVSNLTGRIQEAEMAVDNLCQINDCPLECVGENRARTISTDVYAYEMQQCPSICPVLHRTRIPPFYYATRRFSYVTCCFHRTLWCSWGRCVRIRYCRRICKSVFVIYPLFYYRTEILYQQCSIPCIVRVYQGTISHTQTYFDSCARKIPNVSCTLANSNCQNRKNIALENIEVQERGLTEPLKLRNAARDRVTLLRNQLIRDQLKRDMAQDNLEAIEAAQASMAILKNQSNEKYVEIESSLSLGLEVQRIIADESSNDQNLFEITNITFSVNTKDLAVVSFPITVHFRSSVVSQNETKTLTLPLNFEAKFDVQKQDITSRVINALLPLSKRDKRHDDGIHSKRATADQLPQNRVEDFQKYCSRLSSVSNTLKTIEEDLLEAKQLSKQLGNQMAEIVGRYNVTSSNEIPYNYSLLKDFFNISEKAFDVDVPDRTRNMEQEAFLNVVSDIRNTANDAMSTLAAKVFARWQLKMENTFAGNRTIAEKKCYSFSDCLNLIVEALEDLLLFGPVETRNRLTQTLTNVEEEFVMLADESSFDAHNTVQIVVSVVDDMEENGYWCASLPEILTYPVESKNISVGGTLSVQCEGNSSIPIKYQWRKDGLLLTHGRKKVLTVEKFKITDEGNYTCDIVNDVGTSTTTNTSVQAYELPKFFLTPEPLVTYIGDENGVRFTCNATSRPDPGWLWYFKNSSMSDWVVIEGEETNELLILEPDKHNEGLYYCFAYNYHGNISSEAVTLSVLRATVHVTSYVIVFQLQKDNQQSYSNDTTGPTDTLVKYLVQSLNIPPDSISVQIDRNLLVSLRLRSRNTTRVGISKLPLFQIFPLVQQAEEGLEIDRNRLKLFVESQNFSFVVQEDVYEYLPGTFSVQIPEYLCPLGQELHSNSLLCGKCFMIYV